MLSRHTNEQPVKRLFNHKTYAYLYFSYSVYIQEATLPPSGQCEQ